METICVMGLGYVGLPTASLLATKDYSVAGIDIQQNVVNQINLGKVHIVEPDLDIMVKSAVQSGNLTAFAEPQPADIFIIATPTSFKKDHRPSPQPKEAFFSTGIQSTLTHRAPAKNYYAKTVKKLCCYN